ncbi:SGNH/GDSL hydrolase family protein [Anaeromicropila populeti]|uniref:Lysophospholipase L1 n=1 Tax=Anaeromicropila populeti TaxID=37658 RepID=A0A1I6K061_9FIRM|nr:SGNH/GDSL hydrolase family protein [Anaeromicropila populeti]SFR84591.1 Lysophospholipase L1 [Anaeromicropila populeti]
MKRSFQVNESNVRILGRTKIMDQVTYMNYSCSGIEFEFTGTSVSAVFITDREKWDEGFKAWVAVFVDDNVTPEKRFPLEKAENTYTLYETDTERTIKIRIVKMSEVAFAKAGIKEIIVEGTGEITPTKGKERRIEFIGDSITCGYGMEGIWNKDVFHTAQENAWEAYAAKTARYFNADFNLVSWSGIGIISSWTDLDEPNTSEWLMPDLYRYTDGGMERQLGKTDYEEWDHTRFEPQLIVINLGTNDASYTKGIEDRVKQFELGYYELLQQVRSKNLEAEIICALGAMGQDLCPAVENAVNRFRKETQDEKVHTLVFDVQEERDGIGADWHPSWITQDKMSKKLIEKVKEVMGW